MKTNKVRLIIGGLLAMLICGIALFLSYRTLLSHPNDYTAGGFADGIKNYYTVWYHMENGESISHFTGMNYPYGEQVVFTDNQPLFSNTLRFINQNIFPISEYSIAIVNVFMFFTYLLCCFFLYLIFIDLKLPWWYAAFFSVILTLMAPQMARVTGHYALSYACYIPILTYLLLQFHRKRDWKISLMIGLSVLTFGLLHMYYLAIAGLLLSTYLFFDLFILPNQPLKNFTHNKKLFLKQGGHFLLQVVLPFFCILVWLKLSDSVTDRPENPTGFLFYISIWESLLVPIGYPLGDFINNHISKIRPTQEEGIAYIGLISALTCAILPLHFLFLLIKKIFSKEVKLHFIPIATPFTNRIFIVGLCAALFACGYPFICRLEWLVEYLGPIKQFRSIGRFAWIAYFLLNIPIIYFLYHLVFSQKYKQHYKNYLKHVLAAFLLIIPVYEAQTSLSRDRFPVLPIEEFSSEKEIAKDWMKHVNIEEYQAILPLPYYHVGSENFIHDQHGYQLRRNFMASLQSKLPLASCFMSRTSRQQTLKSIEWMNEPYGEFTWLEEVPNEKDFLLWVEKEYPPKGAELQWINLAEGPLYEHKDYTLYKLSMASIKKYFKDFQAKPVEEFLLNKDSLFAQKQNAYTNQNRKDILIENYEEEVKPISIGEVNKSFNNSRSTLLSDTERILFQGQLPEQKVGEYIFSYWIKIDQDRMGRFESIIEEVNRENDIAFTRTKADLWQLIKCIEGDWVLLEQNFKLDYAKSDIRLSFNPREFEGSWKVDALQARPKGVDLYLETPNFIVKNNRWYGR